MHMLSFAWKESGSLAERLATAIQHISVRTAVGSRPIAVTLWHSDYKGLRVQSQMHTVAERREVGVLVFTNATALEKDEAMIDLSPSFQATLKASKLVIADRGFAAESGLVLRASDGQEIVLIAGVYPYTLAFSCLSSSPHGFQPEYPIENYARIDTE